MFTIDQIKEAHSKVKSGADFPMYVQDLIKLGVTSYSTYVNDGHTEYNGMNSYKVQSSSMYPTLNIAEKTDPERFQQYIKNHQQGETDYLTFCRQASETGVDKWIVDTAKMTCSYYDKAGNPLLVEEIKDVDKKNRSITYRHYTVVAPSVVGELTEGFTCPIGKANVELKTWAVDAGEAEEIIESIGMQIGFSVVGDIQVFETDPLQPPEDNPYAYDIQFTPQQ